jgi:hypothetical protein
MYSPFCMAQIPVVIWTGNNRYQYMPVCAEQDHLYHCHGHCYYGDDIKLDFPESQNCLTVSQPIRQIKTFINRFHSKMQQTSNFDMTVNCANITTSTLQNV